MTKYSAPFESHHSFNGEIEIYILEDIRHSITIMVAAIIWFEQCMNYIIDITWKSSCMISLLLWLSSSIAPWWSFPCPRRNNNLQLYLLRFSGDPHVERIASLLSWWDTAELTRMRISTGAIWYDSEYSPILFWQYSGSLMMYL